MEDIVVLLGRVVYPATRQDLIDAAAASDLPLAVARLDSLDDSRRYADAEEASDAIFGRRAESNPAVVAVIPDICEDCGFARRPGEPHSCIEEKALFAESVDSVSGRRAMSVDLRSGTDRRKSGRRAGAEVDNGGQRRPATSSQTEAPRVRPLPERSDTKKLKK